MVRCRDEQPLRAVGGPPACRRCRLVLVWCGTTPPWEHPRRAPTSRTRAYHAASTLPLSSCSRLRTGIYGRLEGGRCEGATTWPAAPRASGTPPPVTSHRVTKRAPHIRRSGSSPSRRASRGWSRVGTRVPCPDTWSVAPVYASFAQLTSPPSHNERPFGTPRARFGGGCSAPHWGIGAPSRVIFRARRANGLFWSRSQSVMNSRGDLDLGVSENDLWDLLYAPTLSQELSGRTAGTGRDGVTDPLRPLEWGSS